MKMDPSIPGACTSEFYKYVNTFNQDPSKGSFRKDPKPQKSADIEHFYVAAQENTPYMFLSYF